MILLVGLLLAASPNVDCSKVRWYATYMTEAEMVRIARKWGYSEAQIEKGKRCLKR